MCMISCGFVRQSKWALRGICRNLVVKYVNRAISTAHNSNHCFELYKVLVPTKACTLQIVGKNTSGNSQTNPVQVNFGLFCCW